MSTTVAGLRHRHPCPECDTTWTHRIAPNVCRAANGARLRCGRCRAREQAQPRRRSWPLAGVLAVGVVASIVEIVLLLWLLSAN